jgi:hypothetical protein
MTIAPGWYDDGITAGSVRWFDGRGWTAHTAPVPGQVGSSPTYAGQPLGYDYTGGFGYQAAPASDELGPGEVLHWIVPVGRSWQSVVAGYVGLVALFVWILGPVAVALGVLGLRRARAGGHGSGRSVFALVAGGLASVLALMTLVRMLTG